MNIILDQYARATVFLLLTFGFSVVGYLILIVVFRDNVNGEVFEYFLKTIVVGIGFVTLLPIGLSTFGVVLTKNNLQISFLLFIIILIIILLIRIARHDLNFQIVGAKAYSSLCILGGYYFFLIIVRMVQVDSFIVPNWVDGLTHTLLLEKISISEKISFNRIYHVGFHSGALVIHNFTNLSKSDTVLLFSQWLSATCGVTIYLLVRRYTRSLYSSLIALTVYSLFLLFPSFLISWGRYPFLLGLTILPFAITSSWDWVGGRNKNFTLAFFLVLALAFAHYGTLLIWFSFIVVNIIYQWAYLSSRSRNLRQKRLILIRFFILLAALLSLVSSKLNSLFEHNDILVNMTQKAANINIDNDIISLINLIFSHDFSPSLLLVMGVILSTIWKKRIFWVIAFWPVLTGVLIWGQYFLLGVSISSYSNLIIFLSMPFAILSGLTIKHLCSFLGLETNIIAKHSLFVTSLSLVLLVGFKLNTKIFDTEKTIFLPQDYSAMMWIMENTPEDSVFFIESFLWGNEMKPSNGGGWISVLTGRTIIYPKEIGDLYDMCVFIENNGVDYLYLKDALYEDDFDLHLVDIPKYHNVVYSYQGVMIVSVICP